MRFLSVTNRRTRSVGLLTMVVLVVVLALTAAAPASAITADDCATARGFGYTQTDVEIAHDAALIADGVLEAVPTDAISTPARLTAVGIWAIPQGVYRGFEHTYNIAQACDDNDHQQLVKDNLDVKVSTRATQTSVNSLQTTSNSIQSNVNAGNTVLADHVALDLRLKIEENLGGENPIALFELPASKGGYIEMARTIVNDIITKMQATNQQIRNAPQHLAKADTYIAAKKYKLAYQTLMDAYRDCSRVDLPQRPAGKS
jgi:hypothetical protein